MRRADTGAEAMTTCTCPGPSLEQAMCDACVRWFAPRQHKARAAAVQFLSDLERQLATMPDVVEALSKDEP